MLAFSEGVYQSNIDRVALWTVYAKQNVYVGRRKKSPPGILMCDNALYHTLMNTAGRFLYLLRTRQKRFESEEPPARLTFF
jgi:hypothetical protein